MIDVVCGVIISQAGEYLACQRPVGKHLGGLWEFPGGKVDLGETPETALLRELKEELDVVVELGEALSPVIWDYADRTIRLLPFPAGSRAVTSSHWNTPRSTGAGRKIFGN